MIEIPFPGFAAFSEEITLDGKPLRLSFQWNTRGEHWNMDIMTRIGEPILTGVKLVIDYELIRNYADPRLPAGALYVLDLTRTMDRIGRNDIGDKAFLFYVPVEELSQYGIV